MSRTLSAGLITHLAGSAHTRAAMLRLDLVDGTVLAFTDHDAALSFDLGDGAASYLPDTGILPSDLALSAGFDADDMEVAGPIGATVTKAAIEGGRFDDAAVRFFHVNWRSLSDGAVKLLSGRVVQAKVEGGQFRFTVHSDISRFAQSVGRVISAYCPWDFGDARCQATPVTLAATVTAVTDERGFTVSFSGSYANDYFNMGTAEFATGALAGCRPVEVYDWTSAGVVTLWTGLPEAPQVGDTLTLRQGCGKTRTDCMAFANIANFGGFPDVPGTDQVLKYPNPGAA